MKSIQLYHNRINWHIPLLMGCLGFAFFMLMMYTPLSMDDYEDVFVLNTNRYITDSVGSFFSNLYLHYLHVSSRLIPHFFIQFFGVALGKIAFNIANTFMFGIFLWQMTDLHPSGREFSRTTSMIIVVAILVCFLPGFNNALLWQCGACCYLWSAVLILLFNKMLMDESRQKWSFIHLFFFGLLCGWTNEALILGLAAGYIVYYYVNRKALTHQRIIMLAGLFSGIALLIFSPAAINRFMKGKGDFSISSFIHHLFSSFLDMSNLRILPLLLVLLIAAMCIKKINRQFFHDNLLWIVAILVSFIFVLLTGHAAPHSRFGIELFSLILLLQLLGCVKIPKTITVVCALATVLILCQTVYYSYHNYQEYQHCVAQIKEKKSGIVETNEVKWPAFYDRLILRFMPSEDSDYYFSKNDWIERYFGAHDILFLPHRFVERLRHDQESFKDFEMNNDLPFYAKRIDGNTQISKAVFHLSETDMTTVPFFLRPVANKMQRYAASEVETNKVDVITLPEGRFLLVYKNSMVVDRVTGISVE